MAALDYTLASPLRILLQMQGRPQMRLTGLHADRVTPAQTSDPQSQELTTCDDILLTHQTPCEERRAAALAAWQAVMA